jgi:protein gp37
MSDKTKIEWTDATWNPIRGCSRVSEGCRNCYAERTAARFSGPGQPYEGVAKFRNLVADLDIEPHWTGDVRFIPELLGEPLHWKRPRKIFVNSMSDLFHEKVTDEWITQIVNVMVQCERHTFQILTKRPARMMEMARRWWGGSRPLDMGPPHNVWLGVSVEDQKTADERIPALLKTPAAVRWVSYEPALEKVDFTYALSQCHNFTPYEGDYGAALVTRGIDWIVAGGESGPGARPAHPDWFRAARDQCQAAGVPFFFKQWGEWIPLDHWPHDECGKPYDTEYKPGKLYLGTHRENMTFLRVGKKLAGHVLDGKVWQEFPKTNGTLP